MSSLPVPKICKYALAVGLFHTCFKVAELLSSFTGAEDIMYLSDLTEFTTFSVKISRCTLENKHLSFFIDSTLQCTLHDVHMFHIRAKSLWDPGYEHGQRDWDEIFPRILISDSQDNRSKRELHCSSFDNFESFLPFSNSNNTM